MTCSGQKQQALQDPTKWNATDRFKLVGTSKESLATCKWAPSLRMSFSICWIRDTRAWKDKYAHRPCELHVCHFLQSYSLLKTAAHVCRMKENTCRQTGSAHLSPPLHFLTGTQLFLHCRTNLTGLKLQLTTAHICLQCELGKRRFWVYQLTFVTSTEAGGYWRIKHQSGFGIYIFSEWQAVDPLGEILQLSVIPVLLLLLLLKFSQQERPGRQ